MIIRSENDRDIKPSRTENNVGGQIKSNGGQLFGQRYVKQPNFKSLIIFFSIPHSFFYIPKVIRKTLDLNNVFPAKNTLSEKKEGKKGQIFLND